MRLNSILLLVLMSFSLHAQRCAIGIQANESLQKRHRSFQRSLDNLNKLSNWTFQDDIVKIPIVVHVIHNQIDGSIGGPDNQNISDQQIFSQIQVLNEDFRRKAGSLGYNDHPDGADLEIEFFLAQQDEFGQPSSGITRHYYGDGPFNVFTDLDLISSISYWDSNKYLNIWVIDFAGNYLGYGEFPGAPIDGLEPDDPPAETDGVFISYAVFGSQTGINLDGIYSYGRTVTHEIGHWFGLLHIWGDLNCGDDYCDDTPQASRENDFEVCEPLFSRCTGTVSRNMIENYMDYTPDSCMNIFTQDQKIRVHQVLSLSQRRRRLVLNSEHLLPNNEVVSLNILNNPASKENLAFQVLLPTFQNFSLQFYNLNGQEILYKEYMDYPSTVVQAESLNLPRGTLLVRLRSGTTEIIKRVLVL